MKKLFFSIILCILVLAIGIIGAGCGMPAYRVSFLTEGGLAIESVVASKITQAPVPSRPGYDFAGWFVKDTLSTGADSKATFPFVPKNDVDLVAKWERNADGEKADLIQLLNSEGIADGDRVIFEGSKLSGIDTSITFDYFLEYNAVLDRFELAGALEQHKDSQKMEIKVAIQFRWGLIEQGISIWNYIDNLEFNGGQYNSVAKNQYFININSLGKNATATTAFGVSAYPNNVYPGTATADIEMRAVRKCFEDTINSINQLLKQINLFLLWQ